MKDGAVKSCFAIGAIVAAYGIYAFSNPGTDGAIFATVIGAVTALVGYTVGVKRTKAA